MTDVEFQQAIQDAVAKASLEDIADGLMVSRPTVRRWSEGKNPPYTATRIAVLKWLRLNLVPSSN